MGDIAFNILFKHINWDKMTFVDTKIEFKYNRLLLECLSIFRLSFTTVIFVLIHVVIFGIVTQNSEYDVVRVKSMLCFLFYNFSSFIYIFKIFNVWLNRNPLPNPPKKNISLKNHLNTCIWVEQFIFSITAWTICTNYGI